jgi:DNA helicase-2/ATP-dependent DNA helicase PcrA
MRDELRAMPKEAIVTGTIHAAKGLEWEHVFIVGATDGYLPLYHARDKAQLSEERNLLYVVVTRAREAVRLYHAPSNHARSRQHFESPCTFLTKAAVHETLQVE